MLELSGVTAGYGQQVVLRDETGLQVGYRLGEADEVGRDDLGALVDQLVVGVLPVGAGRAPHHRTGLPVHRVSVTTRLRSRVRGSTTA